jgi:hypothetical protein
MIYRTLSRRVAPDKITSVWLYNPDTNQEKQLYHLQPFDTVLVPNDGEWHEYQTVGTPDTIERDISEDALQELLFLNGI